MNEVRCIGFATLAIGYLQGCTPQPPVEARVGSSPEGADSSAPAAVSAAPAPLATVTDALIPAALPPLSLQLGARPQVRGRTTASTPEVWPALLSKDWAEAIRLGLWQEAETHFSRLSPAARSERRVRYARARVALQREQYAEALELLQGLERDLPEFATDLAEYVARAQLEVGPYELAVAYFERRGGAADLLAAARGMRQLGLIDKARMLLDRAVELTAKASKSKEQQVQAKFARAEVLEQLKLLPLAAVDWRWLALEATDHPLARDADTRFEQAASTKLTKLERYRRLEAFSAAADVEAVAVELARWEAAPGASPPKAELLRTQAWAWYRSRQDYVRAAEHFAAAARLGGPGRVSDLYYEARALSRAHQDELAIKKFSQLAKAYPDSSFADHATFRAAHLHFILGQWEQAERAYQAYDARYGQRGRNRSTVLYELALVQLAAKKPRSARARLQSLNPSGEQRALVRHLTAVADLEGGNRAGAVKVFETSVREEPLSFAALAAMARLGELGVSVSSPIATELAGLDFGSIEGDQGSTGDATGAFALDVQLPPDVRWFHDLGFDEDAEAALTRQDLVLRERYQPRGAEALCQLYGQLSSAAQRYRTSGLLVRTSALRYAPGNRTRWAWECTYPDPYADAVAAAEREYDLPPGLIHAVMRQESAFRPRVVSPANAVGLMQLIPSTARRVAHELGVPYQSELLESPPHNILFGAHYLSKLLAMFGDQVPLALAAYNAGPHAVDRWLVPGEKLPLDLWVARIPYTETRHYVMRVLGNWARYRYLEGGAPSVPQLALNIPEGLRAPADAY